VITGSGIPIAGHSTMIGIPLTTMSEPPIVTRTRLNRCELVMEMFLRSYAIVGGSKEEQ